MHNINARMLEWCTRSALLANARKNENFNGLIAKVFCEDHKKRAGASVELYELLWGAYPVLGPCPDVKLLSSFEHDRAFYKDYRTHVCHSVKTFLLGLYLYEKNNEIKKNVDMRLKELGLSDTGDSFMLVWTVTSLFHDMGYFLENDKIEHDDILWGKFLESVNVRMRAPLSNMSSFSKEITAEKESIFRNKNKIFACNITTAAELEEDDFFSIFSDFAKKTTLSYGSDTTKNGIQQYYQYAKSHNPSPTRHSYSDHGIVSALILLKTWNAYVEYFDNVSSLDYDIGTRNDKLVTELKGIHELLPQAKLGIEEAAGAIALHNIDKDIWKIKETLVEGIDLKEFKIHLKGDKKLPFAFLLKLVDELQCWDRPTYSAPEEGDHPLTGGDIDTWSSPSMIYLWYKKDEEYKAPATVAESQFSKLLVKLGKYLDIGGLVCHMDTEAENMAKAVSEDAKPSGASPISSETENSTKPCDEILEYIKEIEDLASKTARVYANMNAKEVGNGLEQILKPEALDFLSDIKYTPFAIPLSHSFEQLQTPKQLKGFDELLNYFIINKQIALTGDPGSGKSTTLKFVAYKLTTSYLKKESNFIPVTVNLGGMDGEPVETYLRKHIDERILHLETDRFALLLDGLNEISPKDAEQLVSWIDDRKNQCLMVACRKIDYIERQLPMKRIDIEPLDVMQIWDMMGKYLREAPRNELFWSLAGSDAKKAWSYFIERNSAPNQFLSFWYDDIGPSPTFEPKYKDEKSILKNLRLEIKDHKKMPGILPLVSNPFLLFAAIQLYLNNRQAPNSRRDILIGFAIAMLKKSEMNSDLLQIGQNSTVWAKLSLPNLTSDPGVWLAYCAFKMFEKGSGTAVPLHWLKYELETQFDDPSTSDIIKDMTRGNILEQFGTEEILIKFSHQIVQEFFAAVHICIMKDYNKLPFLFEKEKWWERSAFDETIRIAAELLNDATELIQSLQKQKPDLAYSCIHKGVYCKEEVRREILNPAEGPVSPRARAAWGESLVDEGKVDSRQGVGIKDGLPVFDWIPVQCGKVKIGSKSEAGKKMGIAGSVTTVELDSDFYISRYPTTRLQFEAFLIDENGYENKENWCELGWRWKGMRSCPELWYDPNYTLDNAPVVGVSWFEAMAFRWASHKSALEEGWQIELPLEAEWEYAARYPDGREFPWEGDYCPGYANIDETTEGSASGPFFLGKPTAVGMYSNGMCKLEIADMCGNVWEWCKSRWGFQYQWPEIVASEKVDHRVIKGGSWYNSVRFANLGIHDCMDADLGVNDVGFRVIMKRKQEKQNMQAIPNSDSKTIVKKTLVLGMTGSGRAKFIQNVSDFPVVSINKSDYLSGMKVQMNYGRCYHNDGMYYFYAPVIANDNNFTKFIDEMDSVIFILSGCKEDSLLNTDGLSSMFNICESREIPFLVAASGSDLDGFSLNRSSIRKLKNIGVTVSQFSAVERSSCINLLDIMFEQKKGHHEFN